jgi:uncharacterized membrane protein
VLTTVVLVSAGALLAVLGVPLVLRRVPPNSWYGLRIRRTMESEVVWYDANEAVGRDLIVFGSVFAATALLFRMPRWSDDVYGAVGAALLLLGTMVLAVRGFRHARPRR